MFFCYLMHLKMQKFGVATFLVILNSIQVKGNAGWNGDRNLISSTHPLDPLTAEEIKLTSEIIKKLRPYNWTFNYISLKEPPKSILLPYFLQDISPPPNIVPRKSFVNLLDRANEKTFEVTVNLDRGHVENWVEAPAGAQALFTYEEMTLAEDIARNDPEVINRCRKLGWTDMSLVNGDQWTMGFIGDLPEYQGRRLLQLYMYGRSYPNDNEYAHPFDFLTIVDINKQRVIDIEDLPTHSDFNKTGSGVPRLNSNYNPKLRESAFREDFKPVNVSSPGVSFEINGNEIQWQKYKMRLGFNGREGPVIYNLNYKDGPVVRPLFYRMSLAEVFIPYGDPRPPYHRKNVFDEGQYGVGFLISKLEPKVDCIGEVRFFNAVLHNEAGQPVEINRTVCVHEEDDGMLWKHTNFRSGKSSSVRAQRLSLTFIANLGNYDYIHAWRFYQDGRIEFNVKLTGILSTNLLAKGAEVPPYGSLVFPQVYAQYHQHYFTLRLDPEVDGSKNSVVMEDIVPLPDSTKSPGNPLGQGFTTKTTILRTAGAARTSISPKTSRTWHVINPNKINSITKDPVGWKLVPFTSPSAMFKKDSPVRDQAGFLDYDTWVTPYKEGEFFPGGDYLNSGLPEWVGNNPKVNMENEDVVVWHNLGLTHVPRTEDFPVMPVETCGITLKPVNFFNENPSLDVPSPMLRGKDEL